MIVKRKTELFPYPLEGWDNRTSAEGMRPQQDRELETSDTAQSLLKTDRKSSSEAPGHSTTDAIYELVSALYETHNASMPPVVPFIE